MFSPLSPWSKPPIISSSEDEEPSKPPVLVASDTEGEWLRSPTKKSVKRRFRGQRSNGNSKKSRTASSALASSNYPTTAGAEVTVSIQPEEICHDEVQPSTQQAIDTDLDPGKEGNPHAIPESEVDEDFERYVRMVDAGCLGYERIGRHVYVVQGWDGVRREGQDNWYHMEARMVGNEMRLSCLCREGKDNTRPCIHQEFYLEFRESHFKPREQLWYRDGKVVMFWHESMGWGDDRALMRFSVEGLSGALNGRAVVTYEGLENGWGQWKCSKDRKEKDCFHIQRAKRFLGEVVGTDLMDLENDDNEYTADTNVSESWGAKCGTFCITSTHITSTMGKLAYRSSIVSTSTPGTGYSYVANTFPGEIWDIMSTSWCFRPISTKGAQRVHNLHPNRMPDDNH
ncbi:hypothetical protein VNI00_019453 [Paramarasmius palmivorus]|uniref:SWIM-type domain-containing protein n=1 Tax=Paramarasmius palmivorus TaxID=297713 RepID=A0AAW0AKZ7_9AGAR